MMSTILDPNVPRLNVPPLFDSFEGTPMVHRIDPNTKAKMVEGIRDVALGLCPFVAPPQGVIARNVIQWFGAECAIGGVEKVVAAVKGDNKPDDNKADEIVKTIESDTIKSDTIKSDPNEGSYFSFWGSNHCNILICGKLFAEVF